MAVSEFLYSRRVQFYETDLAGMVHFSWYLRYMEEAEHAMWREAGISILPADSELGFPRVAARTRRQSRSKPGPHRPRRMGEPRPLLYSHHPKRG